MKKLNKLCCFFTIFILLIFFACSKQINKNVITIGIVQIVPDVLLDEATEGVIDALKEAGYIEGKNINIDYRNAQGDISNINLILEKFVQDKVDMIVTNSSPCLIAACNFVKDIPVVFTVAFHPNQLGIKDVPDNVTGAFDPIEMDDFILMIKKILPEVKKIGIPWNPSEANSQFSVEELRKSTNDNAIELIELTVNSSSEVLQASQVLISKDIDAIIVSADNTVHSAFESVVKAAEEKDIPIFVTEPSFVDRGACAGLGIMGYDWGKASGRLAVRIIGGEEVENIPIEKIVSKTLRLNTEVADKLNIKFPEEILMKGLMKVNEK